ALDPALDPFAGILVTRGQAVGALAVLAPLAESTFVDSAVLVFLRHHLGGNGRSGGERSGSKQEAAGKTGQHGAEIRSSLHGGQRQFSAAAASGGESAESRFSCREARLRGQNGADPAKRRNGGRSGGAPVVERAAEA